MVKFKALKSAKVTDTLTESEKKVLEILRENSSVTYVELADRLKISRKTVSQKMKLLKDKGIIVRVGSAKKGHWKLL